MRQSSSQRAALTAIPGFFPVSLSLSPSLSLSLFLSAGDLPAKSVRHSSPQI